MRKYFFLNPSRVQQNVQVPHHLMQETNSGKTEIECHFFFQFFHSRLLLSDRLQTDSEWFRVGQEQHRQRQQPQGLPSQPLRKSSDASLRSFPWIFHDSFSKFLELQLHGRASRVDDEVRFGVGQPEGVLPRGSPAVAFPQLCKSRRPNRVERLRPRRHVRLKIKFSCSYFCPLFVHFTISKNN